MKLKELPKFLKEKIWLYLDDKTLFKMRMICKDWKESIENPRSKVLEEIYKCSIQKSIEFMDGKTFYKDFTFTSKIIAGRG